MNFAYGISEDNIKGLGVTMYLIFSLTLDVLR